MTARTRYLFTCCLIGFAFGSTARAQVATTIWQEDFDAVVEPALPAGWAATGDGWATSSGSSSPGSGGLNLAHVGSTPEEVTTPEIDLSGVTSGTLRFLARRTGTYDQDALAVTASVDGGSTFPVTLLAAGSALPAAESSYGAVEADLPAELLGAAEVVFRFATAGGTTSGSNIRIDDVEIEGVQPVVVSTKTLALAAAPGETREETFTVTNQSGGELPVEAPQVEGDAFSIDPTTAVTLDDASAQVYTVTFAPPEAGSYDGRVVLAHGLGTLEVALSGVTSNGQLGFAADASEALESTDAVDVPLVLAYDHETPLEAVEFTVSWDDRLLSFVEVVRGDAVANETSWALEAEATGASAKIVLLGQDGSSLSTGSYDPVLTVRLASGAVSPEESRDVTLSLSGLVGALATVTGDDAGLALATDTHVLTIARRRAYLASSASTLDLGTVEVGQTATATVTLSNPEGTRDLTISGIDGSNERFAITPATAVIAPDATQDFEVTFTPTATAFGGQAGRFDVTHDGEEGPTFALEVTGTGTHGRGDAQGDGIVDVLDLVYGIDFVLGRETPEALQRAAVDLHPFPDGNDALDVRDLTVFVQALLNGGWPDDVSLPEAGDGGASVAAFKAHLASDVVVRVQHEEGLVVDLDLARPIRALQLDLSVSLSPDADVRSGAAGLPPGTTVLASGEATEGRVRVILYRLDGGVIAPGGYHLAHLPGVSPVEPVEVEYASAVDPERRRIPVEVLFPSATRAEDSDELPETLDLGAPYPNPFSPGGGSVLHIPVALPEADLLDVAVFDLLGRRVARLLQAHHPAGRVDVAWDGADARGERVAPGVYVVRLSAGTALRTRLLVVTREE